MSDTESLVIEQVAIDLLKPDPANARNISKSELDALTRSLREFDIVEPILARRDGTVIGGHQRLLAARRLGLEFVPVIWLDISAERGRLLGLALNRTGGEWDEPLLARLLADLKDVPGVDLTP
jgi:ParB-like chromosome segregation protein Spo0J